MCIALVGKEIEESLCSPKRAPNAETNISLGARLRGHEGKVVIPARAGIQSALRSENPLPVRIIAVSALGAVFMLARFWFQFGQ